MLHKYLLLTLMLLTGCSNYVTKPELAEVLKKVDQNFAYQGQMLQASNEVVFKDTLAKGRAAKCPAGFDIRTGLCLEVKK